MPARKTSTKDRILNKSKSLFNQHGYQTISAKRVAASIGLSAGNVTYHFKKKEDLLLGLLDQLEHDVLSVIELFPYPAEPNPSYATYAASLASMLQHTFSVLWDYRFIFRELSFILGENKALLARFVKLRSSVVALLVEHFHVGIKSGVMTSVNAPSNEQLLADNIWLQWTGWLSQEAIYRPNGTRLNIDAIIYNCCVHYLCLVQPYLNPEFAKELAKAIEHKQP